LIDEKLRKHTESCPNFVKMVANHLQVNLDALWSFCKYRRIELLARHDEQWHGKISID
jgi:hypothetical protein